MDFLFIPSRSAWSMPGRASLGSSSIRFMTNCSRLRRAGSPLEWSDHQGLQHRQLNNSLLVTGFAYDIRDNPNNNLDHFARVSLQVQGMRRTGSAALDLCYVAAGRFDGFWEVHPQPWDMAAGIVILQEAGGLSSSFRRTLFHLRSGTRRNQRSDSR